MSHTKVVRVVLYIRVSTLEQAEHGHSIEEQRERLIAYCKARGWLIVGIYVDPGHSGAKLDRPDMIRLLDDIGTFDAVLVYKLDRLSRSQKDMLHLIEDVFLPNNIDFVSMTENIDTSTPFGRAMIGILSAFAQLEREQFKERSLMGRDARAKKGFFHGGKHLPIGYDRDDGRLVINPYEAEQVRLVYDLYLQGYGYGAISDYMVDKYFHQSGGWEHPNTVKNVLTNNVYLGYIKFRDKEIPNSHEPIISQETWDAARAIHEVKKEDWSKQSRSVYLLTGHLYCENCGARMGAQHKGETDVAYYICYSRGNNKTMVKDPTCKTKWWRCEQLDARIDYAIRQICFDKKHLQSILHREIPETKPKLASDDTINKRIKEIDEGINKFMELYQYDDMPANVIAEKISALQKEKTALRAQLEEKSIEPETLSSELTELLSNVAILWDVADVHQKRMLIASLIRRIVVNDDAIKIEWTFEKTR